MEALKEKNIVAVKAKLIWKHGEALKILELLLEIRLKEFLR